MACLLLCEVYTLIIRSEMASILIYHNVYSEHCPPPVIAASLLPLGVSVHPFVKWDSDAELFRDSTRGVTWTLCVLSVQKCLLVLKVSRNPTLTPSFCVLKEIQPRNCKVQRWCPLARGPLLQTDPLQTRPTSPADAKPGWVAN